MGFEDIQDQKFFGILSGSSRGSRNHAKGPPAYGFNIACGLALMEEMQSRVLSRIPTGFPLSIGLRQVS